MKASFDFCLFDHVNSIADTERIHSEVIALLLSGESPLSVVEKSFFLTSLLGLGRRIYRSINSITGFQGIDILIRAGTSLFVIENKLKSLQHYDQRGKYANALKNHHKIDFWMLKGVESIGFYSLSLVGENPARRVWKNIDYRQLLDAIREAEASNPHPLISAYFYSLENLMEAVLEFNNDHRSFELVFTGGALTKWQRSQAVWEKNYRPAQAYILRCHLEPIFQKMFMIRIARCLDLNFDDTIEVNETAGVTVLHVRFAAASFEMNNHSFHMGFQLECQSFKINMITNEPDGFMQDWILPPVRVVFRAVAKEHQLRFDPRRNNPGMSMSKRLKPFWEYSFDELVECVNNECVAARSICNDLKTRIDEALLLDLRGSADC